MMTTCPFQRKKKRKEKTTLDKDTSEIFNETPHLIILNLYQTLFFHLDPPLRKSVMVQDQTDGGGHNVGSRDHSSSETGLKCQSVLLCTSHSGGSA